MNLKQLRKSKKLTQVQAAELCGLSRKGYQNLEEGKNKKKNSSTLLYCLTRLEEYGSTRLLREWEVRRQLEPRIPFLGCSFLYICGGVAKGPEPEGPLILFGDFSISEEELADCEEELSDVLGKETQMEDFRQTQRDFVARALRNGIRLYPKKDEH